MLRISCRAFAAEGLTGLGTITLMKTIHACHLQCWAQCASGSRRFVQFMRDRKLTPQPMVTSDGAGPVYVVLQNEVETPGGMPHIAELPNAVTAKQVRDARCCSAIVACGSVPVAPSGTQLCDCLQDCVPPNSSQA